MTCSELESKHEFVLKVRDLVKTWPRSIFVVMRYIFAFLNHLSEYRYTSHIHFVLVLRKQYRIIELPGPASVPFVGSKAVKIITDPDPVFPHYFFFYPGVTLES